ncbi:MAG TPA: sugar phosphate isomerase/epimerase [Bryobacteraceae bacterium]|jgi:sugar phosphate isomerase/epimerase|nr:sugar phosphate isomerase/epimerase [Bryobacteraceae bacterium]
MQVTRRQFVKAGAALSAGGLVIQASSKSIPIGLELYSVRDNLAKDPNATLSAVAKMGYQCVEFFAPYFKWSVQEAKERRALLDSLGMRCNSTHNDRSAFNGDGFAKAIELNQILGAHYIVLSSAGNISDIDGWKRVADLLNEGNRQFALQGLHAGYHNHDLEWKPIDGQRPMDVLAQHTDPSIMLQLDVGTCVAAGNDPVAWIQHNPGRIRSLHLKDWSSQDGYRVLFGEGTAPWAGIFKAAENGGGVEYYLIEQEGSRFPEIETAERCLRTYQKMRGE